MCGIGTSQIDLQTGEYCIRSQVASVANLAVFCNVKQALCWSVTMGSQIDPSVYPVTVITF